MSQESFQPRKIEHGWYKRWIKQSLELWSRSPIYFILNLAIIPFIASSMDGFGLTISINVFFTSFILTQLRILDNYSSGDMISVLNIIKENSFNLLKLLILLFFIVLTFVAFVYTYSLIGGDHHSLHQHLSTRERILHLTYSNYTILNLMSDKIFEFFNLVTSSYFVIINFLVLLIGYNTRINLLYTFEGIGLNLVIYFIILFAPNYMNYFVYFIDTSLIKFAGKESLEIINISFLSFLSLTVLTFTYLWCREMFEGRGKNAKALSKVKILQTSNQSA